jgi:hypothetical protein
MGLARYAALVRLVAESEHDGLPDDALIALDWRFARLRGADAARARFIDERGLDRPGAKR